MDQLTEGEAGDETAVFAWDQRGHGNSPGARGNAEHLGIVVKDADLFARHVAEAHGVFHSAHQPLDMADGDLRPDAALLDRRLQRDSGGSKEVFAQSAELGRDILRKKHGLQPVA